MWRSRLLNGTRRVTVDERGYQVMYHCSQGPSRDEQNARGKTKAVLAMLAREQEQPTIRSPQDFHNRNMSRGSKQRERYAFSHMIYSSRRFASA